jgi:hypothetical protein
LSVEVFEEKLRRANNAWIDGTGGSSFLLA